jgi:hypothetical protein
MDASIKSVGIDIDKIEKATGLTEAQFKAD